MGAYPTPRNESALPADLQAVLAELQAAGIGTRAPGRGPVSWSDLGAFGPGGSGLPPPSPQPQPAPAPIDWQNLSQFAQPNLPTPSGRLPALPSQAGDEYTGEDVGRALRRDRFTQQFGVDPDAPDFQSQVGGNFAAQAIPQIALGALPVVGSMFGRLAQAAPRAATGVAAAGAAVLPSTTANPQGSQPGGAEEVQQLQRMLQTKGYYRGPIDGRMGTQTQEAQQRYQTDQNEAARLRVEAARTSGQQAETERLKQESERRAKERDEGQQRLREMEGNVPWYQRAWQDYGPLASVPAGLAAGMWGRGALGKQMAGISQRRADRADALMQPGQRGGVPGRIGRTNQYWTEGAPGQPAPFTFDAGRRPYPFTPNPNAAAAESLYQPSMIGRVGPGAAIAGAGGLEWGASELFAVEPARRELAAAQTALSADSSEANIRRFQAARDNLAGAQALANFGRAMAAGVIPAEAKAQLKYAPARPNVGVAEGERAALDRLLSRPAPPAKRRAARKQ